MGKGIPGEVLPTASELDTGLQLLTLVIPKWGNHQAREAHHSLSHYHHLDCKPNFGQPLEKDQNRVHQETKGFCLRGFGGSRHQMWNRQVTRRWQNCFPRRCQLRGPWVLQLGGSWCPWTSRGGTIGRSPTHPEEKCRESVIVTIIGSRFFYLPSRAVGVAVAPGGAGKQDRGGGGAAEQRGF